MSISFYLLSHRILTIPSFYIVGLSLVGLLVSSTDERLLNSANPYKDGVSPFVLAALDGGLKGYDSFMNLVICVSVVSIGVSCVYGGSRTLTALAEQDYAPKIFTYIDRSGRPLMSVAFNLIWGGLAYIVLASSGGLVFDWLLAVSALAALFTWGSICAVSSISPPTKTSCTNISGSYPFPLCLEASRPYSRADPLPRRRWCRRILVGSHPLLRHSRLPALCRHLPSHQGRLR